MLTSFVFSVIPKRSWSSENIIFSFISDMTQKEMQHELLLSLNGKSNIIDLNIETANLLKLSNAEEEVYETSIQEIPAKLLGWIFEKAIMDDDMYITKQYIIEVNKYGHSE